MEQEMIVNSQIQQMSPAFGWVSILFFIVGYLFFAYCLARLAKNVGMPFGSSFIWALIPIANFFLLLKIAEKPMWWFILLLIP
ncbi:MAG: hypothetical protein COS89_07115, partial [Deltaproteobacteria bacterium CG07_land_8_20_14_0_80_38_7]